jgi:hypothetical protein
MGASSYDGYPNKCFLNFRQDFTATLDSFLSQFHGKESTGLFCFEWLNAICAMDGAVATRQRPGGRSKLSDEELTILSK